MKTGPSLLTPFLRSDAQGAVLAETMLDPAAELTISEVARRAGVLPAVAHREVSRLVEADVLRDRREGNNRLVRANTDHPLWPLMSQLVVETYGRPRCCVTCSPDCPASMRPSFTAPGQVGARGSWPASPRCRRPCRGQPVPD